MLTKLADQLDVEMYHFAATDLVVELAAFARKRRVLASKPPENLAVGTIDIVGSVTMSR